MLIAAQLLAAVPPVPAQYTSPALRDLVHRAAERNRAVPLDLTAYRAHVESEIAVLLRRADGEEVAVSIEQAQNQVQWQRSGELTNTLGQVRRFRDRAKEALDAVAADLPGRTLELQKEKASCLARRNDGLSFLMRLAYESGPLILLSDKLEQAVRTLPDDGLDVGKLEERDTEVLLNLQRGRLTEIAETTGGRAFFPTTMKDVEAAYDKVVAQIRAQYSLGYTSTNTALDGQWRRVQIRLVRPDLRDARVQSRRGYFALYKEAP